MSFSSSVKNELCRLENMNECCVLSELAAVVWLNGVAAPVPGDGFNIRITTENAAFARWIYSSIRKHCGIVPEVTIRKSRKLKKHVSYMLYITSVSGSDVLLEKTGITAVVDDDRCELVLTRKTDEQIPCCVKAFLRGAFLAGGSISDPEKTYHLELTSRTSEQADELRRMMSLYGLNGRTITRKGSYVTYLKEGENIVDFLNIIGAHRALMELENVRILKGMRNNVNRLVNCETANLSKTVNAAVRHVENIRYIAANIGLDKLPASLREIAELRLEHKDLSLTELGQLLYPPLGKSGVNHRLRKLDRIAEKHREGQTGLEAKRTGAAK
ncbi:MAG: DNA-binding protein WhiA [Acetivibrionales bacterium]|nr:DNA-binding protein WhiA [Bacillota bacterium]NLP07904.1 DNA-binding protein WhiA [Clostridiaceae bacterium]HOA55910.1 DNA-binding protein WhiA [Clostridiales bacterium]HQD30444.1 DNA-binding protein WhiA [Clostridiales bacterium]